MGGDEKIAVTMKKAGEMLSVSEGTIKNRIRSGELEVLRIGRSVRIELAAIEKAKEKWRRRNG